MNDQRALTLDTYPRRTTWQPATTRVDGRLLWLTLVLLLLVTSAGLLYLSQASTATELRYRLIEREQEQADLAEEIGLLRCQVAASESLGALEARAARLGLVEAPPNAPIVVCAVPAVQAPGQGVQAAGQDEAQATPIDRLLSLLALRE